MKKVLLTSPIHPAGVAVLEGTVKVIIAPNTSQDTLAALATNVHGIVARTSAQISARIIETARELRVISRTGAGIDNVDLIAAAAKGIPVCNLPGVNALTVAEHTVALILSLAKQLRTMDQAARACQWEARTRYIACDVQGKTLGLVGVGSIGSHVARICAKGLGMYVIGYDPFLAKDKHNLAYIHFPKDLLTLFSSSDFISLHVPASPETHHLVDEELLGNMKETAYLVNTSRGSVVDESSLIRILQQRRIAGAALDVFEWEPPSSDNVLMSLPNVVLTPHSASLTRECVERLAKESAQAIIDVLSGRRPQHIANEKELREAGFSLDLMDPGHIDEPRKSMPS